MKKQLRYFLTLLLVMVASVGWADTYTFTISTSDFNKQSYTANNNEKTSTAVSTTDASKTMEVKWTSNQVMLSGEKMQWQKNKGVIYNTTDLGTIESVAVDVTGGTLTTYYGTSAQPSSSTTVGGGYFQVKVGNATGGSNNIVVTFTIDEGSSTAATTSVAINSSGITNTDIFTGTAAGQLTATVSDADGATIDGATVTWSSSKEDVATIATDGTVTLVAEGTTTITAAYAGVEDVYKPSSATYELTVTNSDPDKPGTLNNPYTVAQALANTPATGTSSNVYVRGIVSKFFGTNTTITGDSYHRYYISDDGDGTTANQLLVFNGKGLNNVAFANVDDLLVGDEVVICGGLTNYNGTKEFVKDNYIVSLNRNTTKVATPTFTPAAGTYSEAQNVEITTSTDGATIYYTTDGTDPDATSTEYTAAIPVTETMTIKAIAMKEGMTDSEIATAEYTIKSIKVAYEDEDGNTHFDFTQDGWGLPTSNVVKEDQFTNNGYTITLAGSTGSGYKKTGNDDAGYYLIFGKKGAYLKLPAFTYDVSKIEIVGRAGASAQTKQNIFVGDNAVSTETTGATGTNIYEIAADYQTAGNIYTLKINSAHNTQITEIIVYKKLESVNVTIGETGYATLYYGDVNLTVPEGVTATAYKVNGTALTSVKTYNAGSVVPAATGVVLNGAQGDYTFAISAEDGEEATGNMLRGSDVDETTTGGAKYYMLSKGPDGSNETVGFYYGTTDGAAFTNQAHKAYLAVPEGTNAKATGYAFNETTGIESIENNEQATEHDAWYTIDGKRVNGKPTVKGIYVVNGKKVVIK